MTSTTMPPALPEEAARLLRSIDSGAVLGATRQLDVLGDVLLDVCRNRKEDECRRDVALLVEHVAATRGMSSRAVSNGLELMARPAMGPSSEAGLNERVAASVSDFRSSVDGWLAEVRRHGGTVLEGVRTILAYDYSSTVSQVVADRAVSAGRLAIMLPEARSLDGGRKYLADWKSLGVDVHLVPDAAIGWAAENSDVVLSGAETLSSAGGCYNTVGTAVVAREAVRSRTPFFVLSILLKVDLATPPGARPSPMLDFLTIVEPPTTEGGLRVHGAFPDLDYTEPDAITGVVTEAGVLSPADVGERAAAGFDPQASP